MGIKVTDFQIYSDMALNSPEYFEKALSVYGRRGVGNVTGSTVAFGVEYPNVPYPGASKVMAGDGQWSGADGTRINFQQYFQYRCFGLMITFVDSGTTNWDTQGGLSGVPVGSPTPALAAGTYDAGGFYLYQRFMWGTFVGTPGQAAGHWRYTYAAFGI